MLESHYLLISKNYLADWLAAFRFSQALGENVRLSYLATRDFLLWSWQLLIPEEQQHIWPLIAKEKGKPLFFHFAFLTLQWETLTVFG